MWFPLALGSAILYGSMWLFARGSKGMPSGVVTAMTSAWAPFLLIYFTMNNDFPWHQTWWWYYTIWAFLIIPVLLKLLTIACQRTQVTVVNPLSSLSTFATLLTSALIFAKSFETIHIAGMFVITFGLFVLYHGNWNAWKKPWPWIVLFGVLLLGANVAIIKEVLIRFPEPLMIIAFVGTGNFIHNSILAGKTWTNMRWDKNVIIFLVSFALVNLTQDIMTLLAVSLGPAPHVVAVKRTSILFAAIGGYFIFKEKDQSLIRLMVSCGIVVGGVILLNL